jgi:hypothetical protein
MDLHVTKVALPRWSSIGYGWGTDVTGVEFVFVGDWRPMAALREAVGEQGSIDVHVELHQVLGPSPSEEVFA